MPVRPLDRRTFLRGAGGAAVALPFLEAMIPTRARAQTVQAQKRFMVWYTANGQEASWWFEGGSTDETNFVTSDILAPLNAHRSDLLIVRGLDNVAGREARTNTGGDGHAEGMWSMLRGKKLTPGTRLEDEGGGTSIDRAIAATNYRLGYHKRETLDAIAIPSYLDVKSAMSYKGSVVRPKFDPREVWDAFFKDFNAPAAEVDVRPAQRRSVLSLVLGEYRSLRDKLGATDKQRLEQHMTEIESLESRINDTPTSYDCESPSRPELASDITANDLQYDGSLLETIGKINVDLAFYAFVCDLTPVANVMWARAAGGGHYTTLGITDYHHELTHPTAADKSAAEGKRRRIITWYAQQLADLVTRLKGTEDAAGGSVFDHTSIYWTSEICTGPGHGLDNFSTIILGKASGAFRTGRCIDAGKRPHNDLLAAVAQAYDAPLTDGRFGDYGTGPLTGVL